jgi:hypothetical protein
MLRVERYYREGHKHSAHANCAHDNAWKIGLKPLENPVERGYEFVGFSERFARNFAVRRSRHKWLARRYPDGHQAVAAEGERLDRARAHILYLKSSGDIFSRISDHLSRETPARF